MSVQWIALADERPPHGEYVLIWVPSRPWHSKSPIVFAKVAKRMAEPTEHSPYNWDEFGPGHYADFEVTHWATIRPPL